MTVTRHCGGCVRWMNLSVSLCLSLFLMIHVWNIRTSRAWGTCTYHARFVYLHHNVTSLKGEKNVTSSIHSRIRINDLCPYLLIFSINVEHYSSQKWVINDNPLELISSNRVENGGLCPIWRVRHWSTSFSLCCGVEWINQLDFKHFKLTPPYINIFKRCMDWK